MSIKWVTQEQGERLGVISQTNGYVNGLLRFKILEMGEPIDWLFIEHPSNQTQEFSTFTRAVINAQNLVKQNG
jgi:hypothetical protein